MSEYPPEENFHEQLCELLREAKVELAKLFCEYSLTHEQFTMIVEAFSSKYQFHIIDTLVEAGLEVKKPDILTFGPVFSSCCLLNPRLLQRLLDMGADVNEVGVYSSGDKDLEFESPLDHVADDIMSARSSGSRQATDALHDFLRSKGAVYGADLLSFYGVK